MNFSEFLEQVLTPLTVLVGLFGNVLSMFVLRKKEIQLRPSFARILIALAVFDCTFITATACIFSLPALSESYGRWVYPYSVPVLLPLAQISLTASVYTTVFTCIDRYIAICRPPMLGCCGRSEENTSWAFIMGTLLFSLLYNITRFFEYWPRWEWVSYPVQDASSNLTRFENTSELVVAPTALRESVFYVQYYILSCNLFFMGVLPSCLMIFFNVKVVKAVEEANQRRARLTKRQQRNVTVTSMLVSVVVVFLLCHSLKLILNCYEVLQFVTASEHNNNNDNNNNNNETVSTSNEKESMLDRPWWVDYATDLSHWLLVLNSSSNIAIYLHKDPKFKAVLKDMLLTLFRIPHDTDSLEEPKNRQQTPQTGGARTRRTNAGVTEVNEREDLVNLDCGDDDNNDDNETNKEDNLDKEGKGAKRVGVEGGQAL